MTDPGWQVDDYDDPDPYDDDYDDYPEPDEPDWGGLYEEHCDQVHGGGDCNCRPPLRRLLRNALYRAGRLLRWHRTRYTDEPPF